MQRARMVVACAPMTPTAAFFGAFVLSTGLLVTLALRSPTDMATSACDLGPLVVRTALAEVSACSDVPPGGGRRAYRRSHADDRVLVLAWHTGCVVGPREIPGQDRVSVVK